MEKEYDVIIVGAGVAGLALANSLNKSTLKVLLMDSRKEFSKLTNSRFGTLMESIYEFGLEDCIIKKYKKFAVGHNDPKTWNIFEHPNEPYAIIDLDLLARKLSVDCEVKMDTKVVSAKRKNGKVEIKDNKNKSYICKIIVDCSGNAHIIADLLGIKEYKDPVYFMNTSLELENCNIPKEYTSTWMITGDKININGGLWLYPYSTDKCQFGHADFYDKNVHLRKNQEKTIYHLIKNVYPYNVWFKNSKITRVVRKSSTITVTRPLTADNYIACGEAGGATTPNIGEGSRSGLKMARLACRIISESICANDFSNEKLKFYEKLFWQDQGRYYRNNERVRKVVMYYADDNDFHYYFSKRLGKLNNAEILKFLRSDFTTPLCLKIVGMRGIFKAFINIVKRHAFGIKIEDKIIIPDENL